MAQSKWFDRWLAPEAMRPDGSIWPRDLDATKPKKPPCDPGPRVRLRPSGIAQALNGAERDFLCTRLDRYGAPGFLAAYNAGPGRWDDYRLHGRPLAAETVAYLGRLAPVVGGGVLPVSMFARVAAPRPPFAAPIFVALSIGSAHVEARTERAWIVRVVDANSSVVRRADAMFVTRTRTAQQPLSSAPTADDAAVGQVSSRPSPNMAAPVTSPSDSLFPARRGAALPR